MVSLKINIITADNAPIAVRKVLTCVPVIIEKINTTAVNQTNNIAT